MTTNNKTAVIVTIVVILSLVFFGLFYSGQTSFLSFEKMIAMAGEEKIYQKHLDYELKVHPQKDMPDINKILLDKMVTESIALQAASEDKLILLDSSFYNSPYLDYKKRLEIISTIRPKLEENSSILEGNVVSIWFFNNSYVGPLGLERSKEIAFDKITALHKEVAAQKIFSDEAGERIKEDATLERLDLAYRNNAIFHFKANSEDTIPITLNPELDKELWTLSPGEVTNVYLAKGIDLKTNTSVDALYLFGQVSSKTEGGNLAGYDDWLKEKKEQYEVIYY